MKKLTLTLVIMLFSMITFGQTKANVDIKTAALAKWGSDYEMIKYEIDQQTTAFNDFNELMKTYGCNDQHDPATMSEECKICFTAFGKWTKSDTNTDWTMVLYEAKNQLEAYNSLK